MPSRSSGAVPLRREWHPEWPCEVDRLLLQQRRGRSDPSVAQRPDGHWRAVRTPEGPATTRLRARPRLGLVECAAWGPGAAWALEQVPRLLGADDDPSGFEPHHAVVADLWRRHPHWRRGAGDVVMHALVPAIIEQKVTGQEAFAGYAALLRRHGERAPGPPDGPPLRLQPSPQRLAAIPSWEWLQLHIDPARSRTVVRAARVADSLEQLVGRDRDDVERGLRSVPGIGVWTAAETRQRAFGDADAVSFGDYHVPADVGYVLTGEPVDDAGLAVLLEPYRPHRGRVPALMALEALGRPRRGPRMAPRTHLPSPPGARRSR